MKYGYARVSTQDQDLHRQLVDLQHCDKIYSDKCTGSTQDRPEYNKMINRLQAGDSLTVTKLDRLGRSLVNLVQTIEDLKIRQVEFISLGDGIDTTTSHGRMIFHILASFAQFERDITIDRVRDGMAKAKARGSKFGRPTVMTDERMILLREYLKQELLPAEICYRLKFSKPSYYRAIKRIAA